MELTIRNEAQAFELLERAVRGEFGENEHIDFTFEDWPNVHVKFTGQGYDSVVTAEMALAIVEFQHAVNRAYARLAYNQPNARFLKDVERDAIRIKAKVEKGSTEITLPLGDVIPKIVETLASKMTPEQLVITVIGVAAVIAAPVMYKAYLASRTREKEIDAETTKTIAMTEQQTKQLEIFAKAMAKEPRLELIREDFDVARNEILRGVADADKVEVDGVVVSAPIAKKLATAPRTASKDIQLNGTYLIQQVDHSADGEVRLSLYRPGTDRLFSARFRDQSLEQSEIKLLQEAEWSRSKVYLSINATELRGEITSATVVGVLLQPPTAQN
ncbi:hypothetical protein [Jeongeupia chitinilytica]|uniref:Uncharacterized protein n=1 Tax=Jeongeupia chitinilytica TaxID=1041641 RepID=A0ABQ3GZA2_9NEIS|nr:hypothetical protein [Jeongeupia chitinilytica]GHD59802.1 hypothetical protein GCM10007350_11590 [Jeongeupia chitinilytica]